MTVDSRDDLAAIIAPAIDGHYAEHAGVPGSARCEDCLDTLRTAGETADAILAAGWVPGELLAAEQARNATLADTIAAVRAVLRDVEESTATPIGWEAATRSTVSIAAIRTALDGPGEEDG